MDFLSNLFGLNESKGISASLSNGTATNSLVAKLNTPAPQLGGRRTAKRRTHKRRTHKRRTHKRKHN